MKISQNDTIAAICTPLGEGAIGIIRLSGPGSFNILAAIFRSALKSRKFISHKKYHGWIVDKSVDKNLDEVMISYMKAPKTYTGEDVVEISCHGGTGITREILSLAIRAGARPAGRGEFTKRAFLNGKMDLSQAEAVIEMIKSRTRAGILASAQLLKGSLSAKIKQFRSILLNILVKIEANLDFEADVGPLNLNLIEDDLKKILAQIRQLIESADAGRILKEGIKVVICGKPNVGKSCLLNAILRESRAIVTDLPGTTRDIIREQVNLKGLMFNLYDTAGIRPSCGQVEDIGIELAREHVLSAELVLLVLDRSRPLSDEDLNLIRLTTGRKRIVVLNKVDLTENIELKAVDNLLQLSPRICVSALEGEGIKDLEELIVKTVELEKIGESGDEIILRARHKECLERALEAVARALKSKSEVELTALDVGEAVVALGEISGNEVSEQVLNQIFEEFCVGK